MKKNNNFDNNTSNENESAIIKDNSSEKWKILVVGKDPEVYSLSERALEGSFFDDRPLSVLKAHSVEQGIETLEKESDIAIVLLCVVMGSNDDGFQLVDHIRKSLKNKFIRLIIIVENLEDVLKREVVLDHEVNGCITKTDLNVNKLFLLIITELRSCQTIIELEKRLKIVENAEEIAQKKEDDLRTTLIENLPYPTMLINKNREVIFANQVALDVGAIIGGLCWRDFGHSEFISNEVKDYIDQFKEMPACGTHCTFCLADDSLKMDEMKIDPEVEAFGHIWETYWIPVGNDTYLHFSINITDKKLYEDELKVSKRKLDTLMNVTTEQVALISSDGVCLEVNNAFSKSVGRKKEDIIGKTLLDILPKKIGKERNKILQEIISTKKPHYGEDNHSGKYFINSVFPIFDERGNVKEVGAFSKNITEQKIAERGLVLEKEISENYINSLPGLFYVFDEYKFVRWNKEWNIVTGYSDDEISGMYGPDFFEGKDKNHIQERMRDVFKNGHSDAEAEIIAKDGKKKPYYFTGIRKKIGQKEVLIGFGMDITELKVAEEENIRMLKRVKNSQKMEAISSLSGGIAHQFNNALSVILGSVDILDLSLANENESRRYFPHIRSSIERMTKLSNQLLAYARGGRYQVSEISCSDLIRNTLPLIAHTTHQGISIDTDIPHDIFNIKVDITQMQMVFSAILINASESMEVDGSIKIICNNEIIDHGNIADYPGLKTGNYIKILIKDNGSGMDAETIDRIFDPFYTTKFTGRGLGMAASYGIIKNHNGNITVDSELGKGTTVSILLPAVEKPADIPEEPKAEITQKNYSVTVLVIDDEQVVLDLLCEQLKIMGYNVLCAATGSKAIEIAETFNGDIELAILDVLLPDMNGDKIFKYIKKARPGLKVIVCSGFSIEETSETLVKDSDEFIQKPFSMLELSDKLKKILEKQ